jgi:hypothetical protein
MIVMPSVRLYPQLTAVDALPLATLDVPYPCQLYLPEITGLTETIVNLVDSSSLSASSKSRESLCLSKRWSWYWLSNQIHRFSSP